MKPIVTYKEAALPVVLGNVAFVLDIEGHPSQPTINTETGERGNFARTSRVIRVEDDGEFETENTIYRRRT